jgi:hypothetical protein
VAAKYRFRVDVVENQDEHNDCEGSAGDNDEEIDHLVPVDPVERCFNFRLRIDLMTQMFTGEIFVQVETQKRELAARREHRSITPLSVNAP